MSRSRACLHAVTMLVGALSALTLLLRLGSALPWPDGLGRAQVDTWLRDQGAVRASFAQGRDQPAPVMQIVASPGSSPPVMRLLPIQAETETPAPATAISPPARSYTVAPGDTFWSIAEDVVRIEARSTSDLDVVSYWHALIDVNRDRLRVPGEPDLIFPGQVFELPPLS